LKQVQLFAQYAFDFCREQVDAYEDCKQTGTPMEPHPATCRILAQDLVKCFDVA
jgi:hypothetical protein